MPIHLEQPLINGIIKPHLYILYCSCFKHNRPVSLLINIKLQNAVSLTAQKLPVEMPHICKLVMTGCNQTTVLNESQPILYCCDFEEEKIILEDVDDSTQKISMSLRQCQMKVSQCYTDAVKKVFFTSYSLPRWQKILVHGFIF